MAILRIGIVSFASMVVPALALGQAIELGGSLETSCTTGEGGCSPIGDADVLTIGPSLGVWLGETFELRSQVTWREQTVVRPIAPFTETQRRTLIAQTDAVWHFRPGLRARPFVGVGVSALRVRNRRVCQSSGCRTPSPGNARSPGEAEWRGEMATSFGMSVLVTNRIRIRSGLRFYMPWNRTIEDTRAGLFVSAGYRFDRT